MTTAEIVAISARVFHRAPIVSTRHFAARRGSRRAGRLVAPWVARRLARQIAVSEFVARHLEKPPDVVIRNGIRASAHLWRAESRVVLVLQRLEREKETLTALRAWRASRLWEDGWSMRVAGEGSERRALEAWVAGEEVPQIEFTGWAANTPDELVRAGILLAPGSSDSFGLAVVEAMAAGVPVVACAGGGHLETVALLPDARLFQPGDAEGAAAALRSLVPDEERTTVSEAGTRLAAETFALGGHIDQLLREYEVVRSRRTDRRARTSIGTATGDDGRSHP
jgi:glycosyltransferase involved in cell wall biosynthesis